MKNKIFILILLALAIGLGIFINDYHKKEVVDLRNFTEYYENDTDQTGGWEIQSDNFYVFTKDYQLIKGENEQKSEVDKTVLPEKKIYTVVEGDTLSEIAKAHGLTLDVLTYINPRVTSKNLKIGQKLNVYTENGIYYKVAKGDNLNKISTLFKVKVSDIKEVNNLDNDMLQLGQELFIKDPNLKGYISKQTSSKGKRVQAGNIGFILPIKYSGISSPFGNRFHPVLKRYIYHSGVDLRAKFIPLYASKAGKVTFAGVMNGYGKIIIIQHEKGYETRYAHLDKIGVKKGDIVKQGELIGKTGQSGRVTGPHLHFEIRINGKAVNPMRYVSKNK